MPTPRHDGFVAKGASASERSSVARDPGPPHHRIAERAYRLWEAAGRPEGNDWEHWFQAERELTTSPFAARTPPH